MSNEPIVQADTKEGYSPRIITFSGLHYHYLYPAADQIAIIDIAVALGREGRFGGHCGQYYSVAQHSLQVSEFCERDFVSEMCTRYPNTFFTEMDPQVHIGVEYVLGFLPKTMDKAAAYMGMVGLLHDASEAYMKDIPSPLKELLPKYKEMEHESQRVIFEKFIPEIPWDENSEAFKKMKKSDKLAMSEEVSGLVRHTEPWMNKGYSIEYSPIVPWSPDQATVNFLARFYELQRRIDA